MNRSSHMKSPSYRGTGAYHQAVSPDGSKRFAYLHLPSGRPQGVEVNVPQAGAGEAPEGGEIEPVPGVLVGDGGVGRAR